MYSTVNYYVLECHFRRIRHRNYNFFFSVCVYVVNAFEMKCVVTLYFNETFIFI